MWFSCWCSIETAKTSILNKMHPFAFTGNQDLKARTACLLVVVDGMALLGFLRVQQGLNLYDVATVTGFRALFIDRQVWMPSSKVHARHQSCMHLSWCASIRSMRLLSGSKKQMQRCRMTIFCGGLSGYMCYYIFSGPAASTRLRLFEVIPCHVMFLYEKRILCYEPQPAPTQKADMGSRSRRARARQRP